VKRAVPGFNFKLRHYRWTYTRQRSNAHIKVVNETVHFRESTNAINWRVVLFPFGFGIFASLAEFERSLIRERVNAGLQAARLRGRKGGRPKVGKDKLNHASALLTAGYSTARAARTAGIGRATLIRYCTAQKLTTEALI
jgi:DNA invertase Pin-like site-specific DNA recombinase